MENPVYFPPEGLLVAPTKNILSVFQTNMLFVVQIWNALQKCYDDPKESVDAILFKSTKNPL